MTTDMPSRLATLSPKQRALLALKGLQRKLDATTEAQRAPIAIVGMGCRFPGGADSPEAFWHLLQDGVDAVIEVPPNRWDIDAFYDANLDTPGKMYTRWGGFLREPIDAFDAGFFGISPREARSLDPQQRLLLEVSWEALEHAGQPPDGLAGSRTGIFAGFMSNEYAQLLLRTSDPEAIDAYFASGNTFSAAVGRVAYILGVHGPAIAVDTACSSSLVAVHLACQSLRAGECDLALAGGANAMLMPESTIHACRARMLAPDGRCKSFDAAADGYARGEGCGVVVLKRLSDAVAHGDQVWAVIRGSAVNQDGRSSGMTVPNGPAQQAVIRQALANAGVDPAAIGYVEAHGTGTQLGDPIEAEALGAVLGENRPATRPLLVGSAKTNFGHLEAAAGVAGLIKTALALHHREIPPHLHLKTLNPMITWQGAPVNVPATPTPWPAETGMRLAGVSSFGFSGTNAHVVLEEAPTGEAATAGAPGQARLLAVSARSSQALLDLAGRYRDLLIERQAGQPAPPVAAVCAAAGLRRSHHEHRLAVVGQSAAEMAAGLDAFLAGEQRSGVASGTAASGRRPRLAFIFPGSEWFGLSGQVLEREPVFRAALVEADAALQPHLGWSVLDRLQAVDYARRGAQRPITEVQPLLFATEIALAAQWRAWGITPDAVVGHSMGELAAACVAGVLPLAEAARLVCGRSAVLAQLRGLGQLVLVGLGREETKQALVRWQDRVGVALSNSPQATVVGGEQAALIEVVAALERRGVFCEWLQADVVTHTPQMAALRPQLQAAVRTVQPAAGDVPFYSTVTGALCAGQELDAAYWARNVEAPVLFATAVQELLRAGHSIFLEISPHPVLLPAVEQGLRQYQNSSGRGKVQPAAVFPSLIHDRKRDEGQATLLGTLGALYTLGCPVDWESLFPVRHEYVCLPSYPWQRERYWIDVAHPRAAGAVHPAREQRPDGTTHPLLAHHLESSLQVGTHIWQLVASLDRFPYLADHRVQGTIVVPAAFYVEMALAAARELETGKAVLEQVSLTEACVLPMEGVRTLQLVIVIQDADLATFQVASSPGAGDTRIGTEWTVHARGSLRLAGSPTPPELARLEAIRATCTARMTGHAYYQITGERGLNYGPGFQGITDLWSGQGEALAQVHVPEAAGDGPYAIHPALMDACFQVLGSALMAGDAEAGREGLYLPVGIESARVCGAPGSALWAHARLTTEPGADSPAGDVRLLDEQGQCIFWAHGLRVRRLAQARNESDELFYEVCWQPQARAPGNRLVANAEGGTWLIFADGQGIGQALAELLEERGERCVRVWPGDAYEALPGGAYRLCVSAAEDYRRLLMDVYSARQIGCRGVVYLWGLDAALPEPLTLDALWHALDTGCISLLYVVQALLQAGWRDAPRLWTITRGAQPVVSGAPLAVALAPLLGLGRTVAIEHPELRATRVDLSLQATAQEVAALCHELQEAGEENEIALRGEERYVSRLQPRARMQSGDGAWERRDVIRGDATYLITGGLGGLGLTVAHWLVAQGARHLVLVGRSSPAPAAQAAVAALEDFGARVGLAQADVASEAQVAGLLARIEATMPPLRGIIHAAGVLDDGILLRQAAERFARVLAPKVAGAWNLHALSSRSPLDFFVLFSSGSSLLGSPGQGNYAAANAFLDALAHHRQAQGLPALSINWGVWAGVGLAAAQANRGDRLAARGAAGLTADEGLRALGLLLQEGTGARDAKTPAQVAVMRLDVTRWEEFYPAAAGLPLLEALRKAATGARRHPHPQNGALRARLLGASEQERTTLLEAYLREEIGQVLGLAADRLDPQKPLGNLGMDSLMSLEMRNRIESSLGLHLPVTVVWSYPTIAALGDYLAGEMEGARGRSVEPDGHGARETVHPGESLPPSRLAEIQSLSDDEAEAALARTLAELDAGL